MKKIEINKPRLQLSRERVATESCGPDTEITCLACTGGTLC